jgi:hypothetical protein
MMPNPDDVVAVSMTRREALALEKLAELGLKANEAFNLVASPASGEHALSLLRKAMAGEGAGARPRSSANRTPRARL